MPLCSVSEMAALTTQIDLSLDGVRSLHPQLDALSEELGHLDRATLAKAFRGALVPQDPNDEPAEVMLARLRAFVTTAAPKRRRLSQEARRDDR